MSKVVYGVFRQNRHEDLYNINAVVLYRDENVALIRTKIAIGNETVISHSLVENGQ